MTEQPEATPRTRDATHADASRVEAAEAGAHHEAAEARSGIDPREHVTATDAVAVTHPHHHPDDPNVGVVTAGATRGAYLAAAVAVMVVVVAVVVLAVALRSS